MNRFVLNMIACSLLPTLACSTLVMRFPDAREPSDDCVGQYWTPTTDGVLGIAGLLAGTSLLVAASKDSSEEPAFEDLGTAIALSALALGAYGVISAGYGFSAAGACRQYREQQRVKKGMTGTGPMMTTEGPDAPWTTPGMPTR